MFDYRSLGALTEENKRTPSPLDIIRSDASAGRTSLEVVEIAESLLKHTNCALGGVVGDDGAVVEAAITLDLVFSTPLSFPICKSLLDLASSKISCKVKLSIVCSIRDVICRFFVESVCQSQKCFVSTWSNRYRVLNFVNHCQLHFGSVVFLEEFKFHLQP